MRRTLCIVLLATLAACSAPEAPAPPSDAGAIGDASRSENDGADLLDERLTPLAAGEQLADLADFDASPVSLRDAGEFLFLLGDGRSLAWLRKEGGPVDDFAEWPDNENANAAPASTDFVHDDQRVWFLAELGDGTSGIVGAAHALGNSEPFFGQPIVIIDVGPLTAPSGIGIHNNRLVAAFSESEGREDPTLIVATENGGVLETFQAPGPYLFDHLQSPPDGIALWTDSATDGTELHTFSPETGFTSLPGSSGRPTAFDSNDDEHVWALENGEIWRLPIGDQEPTLAARAIAVTDDSQIATNGDVIAISSANTIFVIGPDGQTAINAHDEVHSLIADSSSIYWSTTQAVYHYDITR